MGDFNINLLNYNSHSETNNFINLIISHYLLPHTLHPTRVTDHSAAIIDNTFSNSLESDTPSGSLLSQISDHFPQFLVIKNTTVVYRHCTLFHDDYSKFAGSSFINDFTGLSWDFLNETDLNINSKFDTLYEKVHETAIKHVPLKKVTLKQLKLRSKPWIDSHIQKPIKHWDRLLHKFRKTHCNTTEELYKKFRNIVVSENRKSRIKYFDDYFRSNKSYIKSFSQVLNALSIVNQKILSKISLSLLLIAKPTRMLKKWPMCSITSLSMFLTKSVLEYPEQKILRTLYLTWDLHKGSLMG